MIVKHLFRVAVIGFRVAREQPASLSLPLASCRSPPARGLLSAQERGCSAISAGPFLAVAARWPANAPATMAPTDADGRAKAMRAVQALFDR